jgi:hypothetical protein
MLKFIGRFLFFLAVSILLAVGIYALVQRYPSALGLNGQLRGPESRGFSGERFQGPPAGENDLGGGFPQVRQEMDFREGGHGFEGRGGSALGLLGLGKNLVIIALITLAVVGLQKISGLIFRKRSVKAVLFGG